MPPSEDLELLVSSEGFSLVAGVDEVGMGCLAGPVVAAAVVFHRGDFPEGIDDSKKLNPRKRELLSGLIMAQAAAFAIASATVDEIDSINIFHAAKLAMVRAVDALPLPAEFLLIDGKFGIPHHLPQRMVVKGDQLSVSIGAASILAKVFRDRLMCDLDQEYPGYGFAQHKGYGSLEHRRSLQALGPTPMHRRSFSWTPVREDGATTLSSRGIPPSQA